MWASAALAAGKTKNRKGYQRVRKKKVKKDEPLHEWIRSSIDQAGQNAAQSQEGGRKNERGSRRGSI